MNAAGDAPFGNSVQLYKYGNHLTPGLTEVRLYAAFPASFPVGG